MFGFKSRKFKNLESKISSLEKELNNQIANAEELSKENKKLSSLNEQLTLDLEFALSEKTKYEEKQKQLIPSYNAAMKRIDDALNSMHLTPELVNAFRHNYNQVLYHQSIKEAVLQHAFDKPPIIEKIDISAKIHSANSEKVYRTTLEECSCPDRGFRDRPCKHMLYLAYLIGLLQIEQKERSFTNQVVSENYSKITTQNKKIKVLKDEIQVQEFKHKRLDLENQILEKQNSDLRIKGEEIINGSIAEATRITLKAQSEIDEIRFNKNRKSKK